MKIYRPYPIRNRSLMAISVGLLLLTAVPSLNAQAIAAGPVKPIINTILSGAGKPSSALGNNGDFYIDIAVMNMYGPKAKGKWPVGVSLRGTDGKTTAGDSGLNGRTGVAGTAGATGTTGAAGDTGAQGAVGDSGATGATGLTGTTGSTGLTGAAGVAGVAGVAGSAGVAGTTGATGLTGAAGSAGTTGLTGAAGAAGTTGATGLTGAAGATGAQGTTGLTGAAGSIGATGLTGATGAQGAAGSTGATGAQGAAGSTDAIYGTLTLGTIAASASGVGSNATAIIVPAGKRFTLDLFLHAPNSYSFTPTMKAELAFGSSCISPSSKFSWVLSSGGSLRSGSGGAIESGLSGKAVIDATSCTSTTTMTVSVTVLENTVTRPFTFSGDYFLQSVQILTLGNA